MCQYANVPIGFAVYRMALAHWQISILANYSKLHSFIIHISSTLPAICRSPYAYQLLHEGNYSKARYYDDYGQ